MKVLKTSNESIIYCKKILTQGGLVAFPTETVYGLGANAYDGNAVIKIFKAKQRPLFNPLIVHYAGFEDCFNDVKITKSAKILAKNFMPGALTIILERTDDSKISEICSNGLSSQAIRVPSNKTANKLLSSLSFPLAGPSANTSNMLSPTSHSHVVKSLANENITVLEDENACNLGLESTVVDARNNDFIYILRHGPISKEALLRVIDVKETNESKKNLSPGMQKKHYSPKKPLRINIESPQEDEAYICFGTYCKNKENHFPLSKINSLDEAGANLFKTLWQVDESPYKKIAISPIPKKGIGLAINDRILRASEK